MTEELKIIISAQYAELKKGCEEEVYASKMSKVKRQKERMKKE